MERPAKRGSKRAGRAHGRVSGAASSRGHESRNLVVPSLQEMMMSLLFRSDSERNDLLLELYKNKHTGGRAVSSRAK